jgi:hypothetical protein
LKSQMVYCSQAVHPKKFRLSNPIRRNNKTKFSDRKRLWGRKKSARSSYSCKSCRKKLVDGNAS